MRAAIYSRKSKFTGKGESIENQIQLCQDYGKNIGITDFTIYEDEGFSAKNIDRPKFKELIEDAKNKKFDTLICYRLDRISRNVSDFSNTIELLNKYQISFISIKEQFDTSTPMGRAMMYISSVFAQLERETIAERIKDNMYELAKTGRWLGGTPPFGFKSKSVVFKNADLKDRKMFILSPIDEEIEFVKKIYRLYLEKGSLSKVHRHLYNSNIRTKNNAEWNIKNLQLILRNPVYVKSDKRVINYLESKGASVFGDANGNGILTYNKKNTNDSYKDISEWIFSISKHHGIVESSLWLEVQKQLDVNKDLAPRLVSGGYGLFNGILKCPNCGSPMYQKMGHTSIKTGEVLRYYVCQNKTKSGGKKCKGKNLRLDKVEPFILEQLFKLCKDDRYILTSVNSYKIDALKNTNTDELKQIDKEISLKEKQISNLVEQLSYGNDVAKILLSKIDSLNKEVTSLKQKKTELNLYKANEDDISKNIDLFIDFVTSFERVFNSSEYERKKLLIKTLIDSVIINLSTKQIDINLFKTINKKSLFDVESIRKLHEKAIINPTTYNIAMPKLPLPELSDLAMKLKVMRKNNNLTQEQLGSMLGSLNAIRKYESGMNPTRANSIKLAKIFNLNTKYFYDDFYEGTDDFKNIITNKLNELRLSIPKFAEYIGVSKRSIQRWINGEYPTRKSYEKIKDKLL